MNNEVLYKGNIRIIKSNHEQREDIEIIYRILNYKNLYFFAEEITTGCIFPIYGYTTEEDGEIIKDEMIFNKYSYNKRGKYFIYMPIQAGDTVFEFKLAPTKSPLWKKIPNPSIKEVNRYIKNTKNDESWKINLKAMEMHNQYYHDLKLIKQALKTSDNVIVENISPETEEYEEYIPVIDIEEIKEYGYDLSTQDNLCKLIGREEEKKEIIKSVAIKNKSILIIGPSSSGKTSIVESLAAEIKKGTNKWLKNKLIFYVNIASLISGTRYRGDFEKHIQKLIDFCIEHKENIILFIDEIHNLYGLGRTENSAMDIMNILKPYIIKRELSIIGATTDKEYIEYIAIDNAFDNRFDKTILKVPDNQMNIEILLSYIKELEQEYNIKLNINEIKQQEIIKYIIEITDKKHQNIIGIPPIENPKLAKNIIENAFVEAIYNGKKIVALEDICLAIISCNNLSPTFRKEKAVQLKQILEEPQENKKNLIFIKRK